MYFFTKRMPVNIYQRGHTIKKNFFFATCNVFISFSKDHQWMIKSLGKELLGNRIFTQWQSIVPQITY